jgi:cyclophilin family peptidyl-prolyl cis-trans isomerase
VLGTDEVSSLPHDRRGLLTKDNLQDSRDPTFCITVNSAPKLNGLYTVFGVLLEGKELTAKLGTALANHLCDDDPFR